MTIKEMRDIKIKETRRLKALKGTHSICLMINTSTKRLNNMFNLELWGKRDIYHLQT
jgi:hypothetical protein